MPSWLTAIIGFLQPFVQLLNSIIAMFKKTPQEKEDAAKGDVETRREANKDEDRPPPGSWGGI